MIVYDNAVRLPDENIDPQITQIAYADLRRSVHDQ